MRELKEQFASALLLILTVAAVIAAAINFQQQRKYHLPDDGVTWIDGAGVVKALFIEPESQAEKAALREGDVLLEINGHKIQKAIDVTQILVGAGAWSKVEYLIHRRGVDVKVPVFVGESVPDSAIYYQYAVGLSYLVIGLFVYYRRGSAPKAVHFYILCLASFILSCFHYSGKLNNFDKVIYWANVTAGLFAPTIFLHFCLTFPEAFAWIRRRGRVLLVYLPAVALLALFAGAALGVIRAAVPLIEVRWLLDRMWLVFLCAMYMLGAFALNWQCRTAEDAMLRRQLKYLRNGAVLGIAPFTLIYVIPYLLGAVPGPFMKMAVLSLPLIPLTWAYAIARYRLMDVDVIFQQGYVYTLATLSVLGIFYGLIFSFGRLEDLTPTAVVTLVLFATFVFQPIRSWIQEQLDRYFFYKDRYDYRRTLIEFGRELGAEIDLEAMLTSVGDRLLRTLSIQHLAFFIAEEDELQTRFRLHSSMGRKDRKTLLPPAMLDLSFLAPAIDKPYLFFERTRHAVDVISKDLPAPVRQTIADLDLTYYLPCAVRGRTIAYLGISRTEDGDFLSSDDVELLITLTGSIGIAVENARLYRSLQSKVEEYERLKEFSENIVESINVGILAADLDDRVESWNTQIERLTGISRERAVGRRLSELFPDDLYDRFDKVRGQNGVHNIYKFTLRPIGSPHVSQNGGSAREAVVNMAIAPLVAKDYQQIGRLIIFDDITDRSELERRLVQADKLSSIGLLAAGVAHEVNTPLAVISTYAQMLAKQVSGDDQKSKLLEKIAKQTFRASEIVNSLLNFSRTSTTEFVEVDLNRVIRETLSLIEHQLQKSHIEVRLNMLEVFPAVKGNAGKLQQVFLNLFLNARDAMEGGGILAVKTWSEGDLARIDVVDTGLGIAPENVTRIYDPFFTTKAARKGTGLGLSVTYGIVEEHGGSIEVESQPGAGTRFRLDFPLSQRAVHA